MADEKETEVFCEECKHLRTLAFGVVECNVPTKSWFSRRDKDFPIKKNFDNKCADFVSKPKAALGSSDN